MRESYTFKIGPDYTIVHGGRGDHYICLEEWSGRTLAEFTAAMAKRGKWEYRVERYELSRGAFEEHTWSRRV